MSNKQRYRELVALLEEVGVLQLDDEWAERIQKMVKDHKKDKDHAAALKDRSIRDLANDIIDGALS